ncbi:MAG: type II toxin-antitoxin system HicA family toxin [Candidatus Falkowbacteria bacterium]
MGILSNISGKDAVKVFNKIGYYLDHQQGSHMILYNNQDGYPPLCIPNHKELAPGLLSAQIKRAKLTVEEFNQIRKKKKR